MDTKLNREILLAARPQGMVELSNFKLVHTRVSNLEEGEMLIKTRYLTVDPYMRGRMSDRPSYIEPFEIDKAITGEIVGEIVESKNAHFHPGDFVIGFMNWADFNISDGKNLRTLDPQITSPSTALGVLGMPGLTAYFGLLKIGQPKKGETLVVSGAAGAVGSVVGQIGKIYGCTVVGIAGSEDKIRYIEQELGFDAGINYKSDSFLKDLTKACPNGVDIYFDNVGGEISDAVIMRINSHARVVLCGQISMYNAEKIEMGPRLNWILLTKSALMQGFIVTDFAAHYAEGMKQLNQWVHEGRIKYRENFIEGLENAPKAFLGLFKGENIGKQLVKV